MSFKKVLQLNLAHSSITDKQERLIKDAVAQILLTNAAFSTPGADYNQWIIRLNQIEQAVERQDPALGELVKRLGDHIQEAKNAGTSAQLKTLEDWLTTL